MQNRSIIRWAIAFAIVAWGLANTPRLKAVLSLVGTPGGGRLAASSKVEGAAALPMPKLRTRIRNRHLVEDENGNSFFIAGVCPQNLIRTSTPDQMNTYFTRRQTEHFNFAWVAINGFSSNKQHAKPATNPVDARGNSMLLNGTSWNPQNLNPSYVKSVDAAVESAANHGIYLFLDPLSSAYDPGPSDFDASRHSIEEMRQWGEFWGSRYQKYSHVNFALGNDRLDGPQADAVASGLQKYMTDRLMTTDWIGGPPDWSGDATGPRRFYDSGHRWINFNGWYQYHAPQWASWSHYNMVDPVMPTCIFESFYLNFACRGEIV